MKIEIKKEKAILWGIIAVLLLAVVYATFLGDSATSATLSANAGESASAYSGMVGGC